jgi:hypothetical protein
MKDKINDVAPNSKNKNIRDLYREINEFKRGCQHRSNLLKDSNNILNRWKNYFSQLLKVHRVSDVRQIKIHTAELFAPDLSSFEAEFAIAKLER